MGWLRPQTFISQSRGQGAPSKSLAGSVPARGPLPGWQMSAFCLYPLQQGALLPVFGGHEPHRGTCAHEARPPLSARPQARRHSACNDVLQSPPLPGGSAARVARSVIWEAVSTEPGSRAPSLLHSQPRTGPADGTGTAPLPLACGPLGGGKRPFPSVPYGEAE